MGGWGAFSTGLTGNSFIASLLYIAGKGMPTPAALIVDRWIREGKRIYWKFAPVTTPRTVQPGEELVIASDEDLRCVEGVLWEASGYVTSPRCAIRFQSEDFDSGDKFRIDTSLESGENIPNDYLWARGPPEIPFYSIVLVVPFVWTDWAKVSIVNLDDEPITVLKSLYLVSMIKRGRP